MPTDSIERIRRAVLGRLEDLQRVGVTQIAKAAAPMELSASAGPRDSRQPSAAERAAPVRAQREVAGEDRNPTGWRAASPDSLFEQEDASSSADRPAAPTLSILQEQVAGCTRCDELARTRTQTVFGVGNPSARLWFLGEAPGADEDRLGEPFVGRAGKLLNDILRACRLTREEVYILNMIKCRPPGNRNPLPEELTNCRGYLERQFDLIRPEFICCLGAVAAQNLLGTTLSIGKLRGKLHSHRGAKVVCTYHPAFLLRSPSFKKQAWEDMKLLMREMGVEL